MHQALYRKWRPRRFEEVCGQEHITSILRYEVEQGTFNHAYLFCGSRGTGKTSCAKILAKAVNCENPQNGSPCGECASCRSIDNGSATDVLEIDAASNNGVDNIRDIRDEVVYSPSTLKYRVYIVDEVHMLSVSAFNALLKTLEEPPAHVIFILATTELQKLPATIISRCQRFDFRRIGVPVLQEHLLEIARAEGIVLEDGAAHMLAKLSQGGMRDAISLLDLCAGSRKPITEELVTSTVGGTGREDMLRVVRAIAGKKYDTLLSEVAEMYFSAKDLLVFWQDLISVYRDMLVMKTSKKASEYLDLTDSEQEQLATVTAVFTKEQLIYHMQLLNDALAAMQKTAALKRSIAEIALIRLCDESLSSSPEALLSRISKLESLVAGGIPVAPVQPVTPTAGEGGKGVRERVPEKKPSTDAHVGTPDGAAKQQDAGDKRVLKSFRAWSEVIERMRELDLPASSFLHQIRAYLTEDGKVVLRAEQEFTFTMIGSDASAANLRRALSAVLGREIKESDISKEVIRAQDDEKDLILEELEQE